MAKYREPRTEAAIIAKRIRYEARKGNCGTAARMYAELKERRNAVVRRALRPGTLRRLDRVVDRCYYRPPNKL